MTTAGVPAGPGLRVLIVSAYAAPHVGGVEVVVAQQARTLAALGHRVTVLTSTCGGGRRRERADGYTVVRVAAWNGLEDHGRIPLPVWAPAVIWRLARLVGGADIVHVHDVYHASSVLAAVWAAVWGRPLFVTQHVGLVEHSLAAVGLAQRVAYRLLGRPLWARAVSVTAYNPIVAAFLRQHGVPAGKITLTCNGIDTGEFRPGPPSAVPVIRARHGLPTGLPVVLSAGRLVPKKGVRQLLGAAGPGYQIAVAGPGRIPYHVPAGVTFLGPVSRAELRELYQASDLFACPAAGEMLTLVMQEAMACGLPVVATADDAYAGYGLDPRGVALVHPEPGVLRKEFTAILADPARQAYMRQYSRRTAEERFDWGANSAHLAEGYQDACDRARARHRARRLVPLRWRPRSAGVALAVAALGASLVLPSGRHQWALSLLRQPARYTVLSFNRAAGLPSVMGAQQPVRVSFTVGNHEGRTARYRYVLHTASAVTAGSGVASGPGRPAAGRVLGRGSQTVAAGTSWTVSVAVRPSCGARRCRVEVSLPGYRETIAFLVSLPGAAAAADAGPAAGTGPAAGAGRA